MKLVVGLGNPGKKFAMTRHNMGFLVLDRLVERLAPPGAEWQMHEELKSAWIVCATNGLDVVIAKPTTYMNHSGQAVKAVLDHFELSPTDIVVVHDDKDIMLGDIKVQKSRGAAGHNGIKSIIASLGSGDFQRVRVGIASKNEKKMEDTVKFVLGRFGWFERGRVKAAVAEAAEHVLKLV